MSVGNVPVNVSRQPSPLQQATGADGQLGGRQVAPGTGNPVRRAFQELFTSIRDGFQSLKDRITNARAQRQLASDTKAANQSVTEFLKGFSRGAPNPSEVATQLAKLVDKAGKLDPRDPAGKATSLLLAATAKLPASFQQSLQKLDLNALVRDVHAEVDRRFDQMDALNRALSDSGFGPSEDLGPARNALKTKLESALLGLNREWHPAVKSEVGKDIGARHIGIRELANGKVEVSLDKPAIKNLVLSGGGAKGAAYPGGIKALEETGALKEIKSLSGSSAGAITAALLASGMDADTFDAISGSMSFMDLIEHNDVGWLKSKLQEVGDRKGNNILAVLGRMGTPANKLEELIRDNVRTSLLDHLKGFDLAGLKVSNPSLGAEVEGVQTRLKNGGAATFGDLKLLSRVIPEIKELTVTGSAMIEGRPQLAIFNAESTPDMDIAKAAHISGSFPKVFQAQMQEMPSGLTHTFIDGGAMLNIPVPGLVNPDVERGPIPNPDALIFGFQGDELSAVFGEDQGKGGSMGSKIKDKVVGAKVSAAGEFQTNRLRGYRDQIVEVKMQTSQGDFSGMTTGTLNFSMPQEVQKELKANLNQAVKTHLEQRGKEQVSAKFDSLEQALLSLGDAEFEEVVASGKTGDVGASLAAFRKSASEGVDRLTAEIANVYGQSDKVTFTPGIKSALAELDRISGGSPEKLQHLANLMNKGDNTNLQAFLNFARYNGDSVSTAMQSALRESEKRDVKTAAFNQIKEIIIPSRFNSFYAPGGGQSKANVKLLQEVEVMLDQATTRKEYNDALQHLVDHYKARGPVRISEPTTVALAKAAMFK